MVVEKIVNDIGVEFHAGHKTRRRRRIMVKRSRRTGTYQNDLSFQVGGGIATGKNIGIRNV